MNEITIPRMLGDLVGGTRRIDVDADTVGGALDALCSRHPELAVHIFDEDHVIRPHVLVFHGETGTRDLSTPLRSGETVTVLQAVSGGALAELRE